MKRLLLILMVVVFSLGFTSSGSVGDSAGDDRVVFLTALLHFEGMAEVRFFVPTWIELCKSLGGPYARLEVEKVSRIVNGVPTITTLATCTVPVKRA